MQADKQHKAIKTGRLLKVINLSTKCAIQE
jgi:hypothetical protein